MKSIAIIGGGNLGRAMAEGILSAGFCQPSQLTITRRQTSLLDDLAAKGVTVTADNKLAVEKADVIILAVKPFQSAHVMEELSSSFTSNKLLISVVTGISIVDLKSAVSIDLPVFRAMPNTAIAIGESMTCICADKAGQEDQQYVMELFSLLGKVAMIEEKLMEAATILGACGTAYAMRYIRASIQGGIEIGFDAATASLIAAQTVKGAAELLLVSGTHPEQEIDKVTTPRGCTIAGLNEMEHRGFSSSLIRGITTSYRKIAKDQ